MFHLSYTVELQNNKYVNASFYVEAEESYACVNGFP